MMDQERTKEQRRTKNCTQCWGKGTSRVVRPPARGEGQLRRIAVVPGAPDLSLSRTERRRRQHGRAYIVALHVGKAPPVLTVTVPPQNPYLRIQAPPKIEGLSDWKATPATIHVVPCGCTTRRTRSGR